MTKIADLILADPAALLELSITDAAARAGTSAATLTRFCHQLGYAGYVQFRVALASDLGHDDALDDAYESWRTDIGREFDPDDAPEIMLRTLLSAQARALEATAALIDLDSLARTARTIWRCKHLDIYGIAGSAEMASELRNRLYRIGVNAHTWGEVHQGLAERGDPARQLGRDRHLEQRTHHRDDRDARRRQVVGCVHRGDHQRRHLAARPGRRRRDRQRHAEALPPARRPLRQARPAAGARPHLPARRPAGLRRDRVAPHRVTARRERPPPAGRQPTAPRPRRTA